MRFVILALAALAAAFVVFGLPAMSKPATPSDSARLARPSPSVPQSPTPAAPDWAATANAADAQARYVAGVTATAQANAQATQTARAGATLQAVTLQWADVMQRQTQAALTVTLQAAQAAQATGTFSAGAATASATAAIPAMTATREAQQVQREEQSRNSWWWLVATVTAFLGLVGAIGYSVSRYLASLGVKAEAEAYRISAQTVPAVVARQEPGPGRNGYVVIMVREKPVVTELPALAADQPAATVAAETPRPHMTKAQQALIAFIRDAQRATGDWSAAYIPSDAAMGCAGSRWAAHVGTLKELSVVTVSGTGRPKEGEARTKLTGDWDLGRVLAALENGQLIVPTQTGD